MNERCILDLARGSRVSDLMGSCDFVCTKKSKNSIFQLTPEKFVLLHRSDTATVRCREKIEIIELPKVQGPGALEINIPCHCSLQIDGKEEISENFPCDLKSVADFSYRQIIPVHWTNLEYLEVPSMVGFSKLSFSNSSEFLKTDWNQTFPHLNIHAVEDFDEKEPNFDIKLKPFERTGQHLSIFNIFNVTMSIVLVFVLIKNPFLLGLQLVRPANAIEIEEACNWISTTLLVVAMLTALVLILIKSFRRRRIIVQEEEASPMEVFVQSTSKKNPIVPPRTTTSRK